MHAELKSFLESCRLQVKSELISEMESRAQNLGSVLPIGSLIVKDIVDFTLRGKMLRACLVFIGAELAGKNTNNSQDIARVAASLELAHSGFLIIDDIMDRDVTRRGTPSFHIQYANRLEKSGSADSRHLGESIAQCAATLCIFESFQLLSKALAKSEQALPLVTLSAQEYSAVCIGQLDDVLSSSTNIPNCEIESIIQRYRIKTGRYSFSYPLRIGYALAQSSGIMHGELPQTNTNAASIIDHIGENAGIAFQIRDDDIGIFGDAQLAGKPIGSDIEEGKITLHIAHLVSRLDAQQKNDFQKTYAQRRAISCEEHAKVIQLIEETGARKAAMRTAQEYASKAISLLGQAGFSPDASKILEQLIDYSITRNK